MKGRAVIGAGVLIALALVAGCSSGSENTTGSSSTSTSKAASADGDVAAFCAGFADLGSRRDPTVQVQTKDQAGWALDIAAVKQMAAAAPADQVENANAYVTMMEAREKLAAAHDYGTIPAADQMAFVQSHAALQQQVNALLAAAKGTCADPK